MVRSKKHAFAVAGFRSFGVRSRAELTGYNLREGDVLFVRPSLACGMP